MFMSALLAGIIDFWALGLLGLFGQMRRSPWHCETLDWGTVNILERGLRPGRAGHGPGDLHGPVLASTTQTELIVCSGFKFKD